MLWAFKLSFDVHILALLATFPKNIQFSGHTGLGTKQGHEKIPPKIFSHQKYLKVQLNFSFLDKIY
jgi:hypothetical protein